MIVNAGGVAAVVDYIGESRGNVRLPGVMTLGYVGALSENLAMAVIRFLFQSVLHTMQPACFINHMILPLFSAAFIFTTIESTQEGQPLEKTYFCSLGKQWLS